MKRKALALTIALMLGVSTLSACGDPATQPTATPSQVPETTVSAEPSTGASSEPSYDAATVKEFPLPADGTIDSLNETLAASGYPELSSPKSSPGETTELGVHTAYTYSLGDGSAFVLYVSDATENILNFTVLTVASTITSETMEYTQFLMGCLVGGLSGDEAVRISGELGVSNVTDDTFAMASTDLAEFMYMVQDSSLTLMITPA